MVHTQKELEDMPRTKLQAICKGYGFKANEGTAKIIANILASDAEQEKYNEQKKLNDSSASVKRRVTREFPENGERRVTRGSLQDSMQTRRSSSRNKANPYDQKSAAALRKSKLTQVSLGVGRPKMAGGSGARAPTRHVPKETRQKQFSIVEEDETAAASTPYNQVSTTEQGDEGHVVGLPLNLADLPPTPIASPRATSSKTDGAVLQSDRSKRITQGTSAHSTRVPRTEQEVDERSGCDSVQKEQLLLITDLRSQVESLRQSINAMPNYELELGVLRATIQDCATFQSEVASLRDEIRGLRAQLMTSFNDATHSGQLSDEGLVTTKADIEKQVLCDSVKQVLGKRQRESTSVTENRRSAATADETLITGMQPSCSEAISAANSTNQSPRKKLRTAFGNSDLTTHGEDFDLAKLAVPLHSANVADGLDITRAQNRITSDSEPFSKLKDAVYPNYSAEDMLGVAPPNAHLQTLDLLRRSPPPLPFALVPDYSFHYRYETSGTQSELVDRRVNRTPMRRKVSSAETDRLGFKAHQQMYPPGRQISPVRYPSTTGIDPAFTTNSNTYVDHNLTTTPAAARTLFGTELEDDNRFGEYGLDGLASGFWKTGNYHQT